MSDSITKCVCFAEGGNTLYHVVHYHLEDGVNSTDISVIVHAIEMSDPEDLNELKTKANEKALVEKSKWLSQISSIPTEGTHASVVGPVTLE